MAKAAGIPRDMLHGWLRGKVPRASSCRYLLRLEAYFGLERLSIVRLSGMKPIGFKTQLGGAPTPVEYNERIGELTKIAFCHKPDIDSPLRQQWYEFMRYKSVAVPAYKRTKRGKWRVSPCPVTPETPNTWWAFLDGREIASARFSWARISAYLGWLAMPRDKGGIGLPRASMETLAWLVIPDYLEAFLDWSAARAGKRNQGVTQHLAIIAALVRPGHGYLRQRPELLETLPKEYHDESWEHLCDRQFQLTEQLVGAYHKEIEVSRDSFAPIRSIIDLPQPMDAIVDMVRRMRAARPVGRPRMEPVWSRDMALIKLLSCFALRQRNLAHLTWCADNTGDLYQKSDTSWWVRLPKSKFKNAHGAAGDNIYDCQLDPSAWQDIERYIKIYRPMLMKHPTDLLLLTREDVKGKKTHRPWNTISQRVHELTMRYIPNCCGFGAHAFRHIVATAILKADGGDYKTVAKVLNDRVSTVEKHYDGLTSNDGIERMGQLLHCQFAQM